MQLSPPTAKPAPSTTRGGHFVDRSEHLGAIRRQESEQALAQLGIRASHIGLPDGQMHDAEYRAILASYVTETVRRHDIEVIATLGCEGFCGHSDHVAAHDAAVNAQQRLAKSDNLSVPILALNCNHQGALRVPVERERKLAALALHRTQFGYLTDSGAIHANYQPLLYVEIYDIILPIE